MSLIILEGPDGAGKTTLGRTLSDRYGLPIEHSPVTGGLWQQSWDYWTDSRINERNMSIADRCPEISEAVYGIDRGKIRRYQWFKSHWSVMPVFLVFCIPVTFKVPVDVHLDVESNAVNHIGIYERYRMLYEVYNSAGIPTYLYHWTMGEEYKRQFDYQIDTWVDGRLFWKGIK